MKCVNKDETRNIYIKQPTTMVPQVKGGTNLSETGADGWSSDDTNRFVAGIEIRSEIQWKRSSEQGMGQG